MTQLSIDFLHAKENNDFSQKLLDNSRPHLNNQCQRVYDLLLSGVALTVISAMNDYQIMSLPRRILDIERSTGIVVKRQMHRRTMTYYL